MRLGNEQPVLSLGADRSASAEGREESVGEQILAELGVGIGDVQHPDLRRHTVGLGLVVKSFVAKTVAFHLILIKSMHPDDGLLKHRHGIWLRSAVAGDDVGNPHNRWRMRNELESVQLINGELDSHRIDARGEKSR